MLHVCRRNLCGISEQRHDNLLRARVSNIVWREKNRRSDEISTVFIAIYGNKRSGANNCATFSRSRIKCISDPLIITSAARGRVL